MPKNVKHYKQVEYFKEKQKRYCVYGKNHHHQMLPYKTRTSRPFKITVKIASSSCSSRIPKFSKHV